jgi:predicted HicB family RNase H-like nuclease
MKKNSKITCIEPETLKKFKYLCVEEGIFLNGKIAEIMANFCKLDSSTKKIIALEIKRNGKKFFYKKAGATLTLHIDKEIFDKFNEEAELLNITKSDLIRYLLGSYQEKKIKNNKQSEKKISIRLNLPDNLYKKIKKKAIKDKKTNNQCIIDCLEQVFTKKKEG